MAKNKGDALWFAWNQRGKWSEQAYILRYSPASIITGAFSLPISFRSGYQLIGVCFRLMLLLLG